MQVMMDVDLRDQHEYKMLSISLNNGFVDAYLFRLWQSGMKLKNLKGVFAATPSLVASICDYKGDAEEFFKALVDTRWLIRQSDGFYYMRGWKDRNGKYLANNLKYCNRMRSKRADEKIEEEKSSRKRRSRIKKSVPGTHSELLCVPLPDPDPLKIDRSIAREKIYEQSEHLHSASPYPVAEEKRTQIVEAALLADEDEGFDELIPDDAPTVSDAELMSGYEDKDKAKSIEGRPSSMEVMGIKINLPMSSPLPSMTSQDASMPTAQAFAILSAPPTESGPIPHKRRWAEKDAHLFAGEFPAIYLEPFARAVDIAGEKSGREWSNPSVVYLRTTYRNELARWREASGDKRHGTKHHARTENAPQAKSVGSVASVRSMGAVEQTTRQLDEVRDAASLSPGEGYLQAKRDLQALGIMD